MNVHGLLLAAGGGSRMGMPKALVHDAAGSWLRRGVDTLQHGGCVRVTVVLGARAEEASGLLAGLDRDSIGPEVKVVEAEDWAEGMSASLHLGLGVVADADPAADAVLLSLVDLPDLVPEVVRRVVVSAADADAGAGAGSGALARAAYDGRPGHPVLIGRDHWAGVLAAATGDAGARDYLAAHEVSLVECGDLASGRDVDSLPPAGTPDRPSDRADGGSADPADPDRALEG